MKTVVSNTMVARLWAHQLQESARSSNRNIWFEGTTLYSYSTPIANFVTSPRGERIALVSSQEYLGINVQHLKYAKSALGYGDNKVAPSFHVPYVYLIEDIHERNAESLLADYNKAIEAARRSIDPLGKWNRDYFHAKLNTVRQYIETFNVTLTLPNFDDDWQTVVDVRSKWGHFDRTEHRKPL